MGLKLHSQQLWECGLSRNQGPWIGSMYRLSECVFGLSHRPRQALTMHSMQVINATGPFSDSIRQMSDPGATKMIMASAGVHVTLPDYYSPEHLGMIVPKTKDGRVVFMLPWLDATIAGTTGGVILLSLSANIFGAAAERMAFQHASQ